MRRRLSKRLYIPLPDAEGRAELWRLTLAKARRHSLSEQDIEGLVGKTRGMSGSDITTVAEEAAIFPLKDADINSSQTTVDTLRPIELADIEAVLREFKATVSEEEIKKYEDWNDKFGTNLAKS